jgi:hypothetical protein
MHPAATNFKNTKGKQTLALCILGKPKKKERLGETVKCQRTAIKPRTFYLRHE